MQTEIEILTDAQRLRPDKSEVERLWADNTKALALLGSNPPMTGWPASAAVSRRR